MPARGAFRGRRAARRGALALAAIAAGTRLAFVGGTVGSPKAALRGAVSVQAEESGSSSVALVKVTEENTRTTAGLIGGVVGLLTGGVWVGAGLFAVTSYLTRKDDDVSTVLKSTSASALEVLNFGSYLNDKYSVTSGVGDAFNKVLEDNPETKKRVDGVFEGVAEAYESVDKDIGIKDSLGTILTSGGELASQAVEKVIEINEKYKITDQVTDKVNELVEKAKSGTAKKA